MKQETDIYSVISYRSKIHYRTVFMSIPVREPIIIFKDDQGCKKLMSGFGAVRSKHIVVCYHHMKNLEKKIIEVQHYLAKEQQS